MSGGSLTGRTVLVTGGAGFVGGALVPTLERSGARVRLALRRPAAPAGDTAVVGEIGPDTDWSAALRGVEVVIHLAAHVHQMQGGDPEVYRRVNALGTERLARASAAAGVRRLVFVSSVKVNGEEREQPYSDADPPAPRDAYGESKLAAEQALARISAETGLETVTLRPPLVYGPGVGANFRALMRAVWRGVPLPLASVRNRRSLIYVGNLASALERAASHPDAAGDTFLVSDGTDFATPELLRRVGSALGRPARLLPVPPGALRLAGRLAGRSAQVSRLVGSLAVDSSRLRTRLEWTPPFTPDEGLSETARAFRANQVEGS